MAKVLAVASEFYPLIKTGGLADAAGALPAALAKHGVAVTTMLPGYPAVLPAAAEARALRVMPDLFGGPARIIPARHGALDLLVVDAPHLFARAGNPYTDATGAEWGDNGVRFAGLAAAAAFVAGGGLPGRKFSAVHAHDWQTGLVAPYMKFAGHRPGVLFTIHNLAFQGKFPAALFPQLGLPQSAFARDGIEYYGGVGFLKAALWFADRINTVSPTYAAEIATPALGMGLDGLIRGRADVTSGILNGIDDEEWNPATDAYLPARYSAADPSARAANKAALQAEFGLAPDPNAPLFAFIGRLSWQKGFDLVLEALPAIQQAGGQLALLGSGDAALEARGRGAAAANPRQVGAFIGFNERIARLVYGGADAVLVPSRFEPCGLVQLCALRYGAVPIVSRTGGLSDTVIDANPVALAAGAATGFMATPDDVPMLRQAILRAATLYRDPPAWRRVQANAMATDVSWTRSAALYAAALKDIAARG